MLAERQRASDLLLHVGFSALQALSRSGRSRPSTGTRTDWCCRRRPSGAQEAGRRDRRCRHHTRSSGIASATMAEDAVCSYRRKRARARDAARLRDAELEPQDISLVECHAREPRVVPHRMMSMTRIFDGMADVPIGSLKSNLGHSITASGAPPHQGARRCARRTSTDIARRRSAAVHGDSRSVCSPS